MPVPGFPDIGKSAWEIFRSGYHYGKGVVKISVSSKSEKNVQIGSNYTINCDAAQAEGNAEAKVQLKDFGSVKEKWSSDGTIMLEYSVDDKPVDGLSVTTGLSHNPSSSESGVKLAAKFKNDLVNLACSVSNALDKNFRLVGAAVFGFKDLLVGYQAGYDTEMKSMTMNDVGLSYSYENVGIHLRGTSIPHECGVSLFYKVNQNWDTAINGIIARRDDRQEWTVGIGTRMRLDDKTMVRLKLNKDRQMGTSIEQKILDYVTLTLSFNLDLANLSRGDHKVGLGIDIDAS